MTEEIKPLPPLRLNIAEAVERELGKVPAGATVAFVATADLQAARMAVMVRMGDGWSFSGFLAKPYTGKVEAGAELRFSR